jgi:hypothetical protein
MSIQVYLRRVRRQEKHANAGSIQQKTEHAKNFIRLVNAAVVQNENVAVDENALLQKVHDELQKVDGLV